MGPMVRDLMMKSPLLALPIIAMMLFLAVFVGVVIATWRKSKKEIDRDANLPLEDGRD